MKEIFKNFFNVLFKIKKTYKCIAYVQDKDTKDSDSIVEAFEIRECSQNSAYNEAYKILKLKYSNKGLDIRISK